MHHTSSFVVSTEGRGTHDITRRVQEAVAASTAREGLCTVFIHHTSASLIISENADLDVRRDLDAFLDRLVPDGDQLYCHTAEGPDDMSAHVKSCLTQPSLSIPVNKGRCDLGTWQGIYVWEHRRRGHRRKVSVTVIS